MPPVAVAGSREACRGIAVRGLPGEFADWSAPRATADGSAPEVMRVTDSRPRAHFMGYEDHVFAERFGGYQVTDVEGADVRFASTLNQSGGATVEAPESRSTEPARCVQFNAPRRAAVVNRVLATRMSVADNIAVLLTAHTILEGPTAHGS